LETVVPVLVYIIGSFLALQSLGLNLTGLWVAFGGVTFVIGYALQDIIANFFGGLVLLIDTPFRFGDVIAWKKKERAVIKKVGLRLTQLYLIDQHCEVYVPNSKFEKQKILNLSRPNPNYYYTLTLKLAPEAEISRTSDIMEAVALAHPDTLGDLDRKLELIDRYFGRSIPGEHTNRKRETGRARLLAERDANRYLSQAEEMFDSLSDKIDEMEAGGLDRQEISSICDEFQSICEVIGLGIVPADRTRKQPILEESAEFHSKGSLIGSVRTWYQAWLEDPDLLPEDHSILEKAWENRIELLTNKTNKLFQRLSNPDTDDTRLDDAVSNLYLWIQESFKTSRNEWQKPRIWTSELELGRGQLQDKEFSIKFYVDDITLERFQRGYRVESEVNREITWHLRRQFLIH
ncbi:MAG: mechanosensitive ion channel family protein, partial [Prochlorothrix sp.]